jgi:hypothetical protein
VLAGNSFAASRGFGTPVPPVPYRVTGESVPRGVLFYVYRTVDMTTSSLAKAWGAPPSEGCGAQDYLIWLRRGSGPSQRWRGESSAAQWGDICVH